MNVESYSSVKVHVEYWRYCGHLPQLAIEISVSVFTIESESYTEGNMSTQSGESGRIIRITEVIDNKRDGKSLDDEEIEFFIHGVVDGSVEASQLGEQLIHSACS